MLNCEYCDYIKKLTGVSSESDDKNAYICGFTGYFFAGDGVKGDMEYPCKDISYQDYLKRTKDSKKASAVTGEYWKVQYKMKHLVRETKRSSIAV